MTSPSDGTEQTVRFVDVDLHGARFVRTDLSGVVMRAVDLQGADLEAPWLLEGGSSLYVNGVVVVPYVDAELDRRYPGRAERHATEPAGLQQAWASLQRAWADALARAASLAPGSTEVSVDGEWSFAQTLRHLVMATDTWLGRAILELDQPYHPLGQPNAEYATDGYDTSVFTSTTPPYDDVLTVRAERVAMVADLLAAVTPDELSTIRRNPWAPDHPETTLSCLHTILDEEWEHLRYAERDLDAIERAAEPPGSGGPA